MLQIQSKRFYLDVRQNKRGKFLKIAEIAADGRRDQIFMALSTAAEFRDHLKTFSDFYANLPTTLPQKNEEGPADDGKLKSEIMIKDSRRYYLDLKENVRGRFLRVSQTVARGAGPRSHLAIPAQGMIEFRNALSDIVDEFGTDDGGFQGELPASQHMRVEGKGFHFDVGQNSRGIFMKISEVQTNYRTSVTLPEKCWPRFKDILEDFIQKMDVLEAEAANEKKAAEGGGNMAEIED
ncbi:transcriptional activator protein Pur-beta-A [Eurytemora carolleeae]|uniref:transcriptional activator protein Pur-beta-A n=1 Tax=Eurytemora carolleeae TaxID=1294199 RepID=UPI000C77B588|nr:transcriptional activator protein Pur-beta-A [Eurytemora carolleeae]|eukprot:XP_023343663.1 transcriptional activator protein Pur-beta-A-like [Eurytemora affinis]